MASTAEITLSGTISGLPEGGEDQLSITMTNTSAANSVTLYPVTTAQGTCTAFVTPSSAKFLIMIPPSTNTFNYRVTGSTAEVGLPLSSRGASFLPVQANTSAYFYTTGGTTFTLRVITY